MIDYRTHPVTLHAALAVNARLPFHPLDRRPARRHAHRGG